MPPPSSSLLPSNHNSSVLIHKTNENIHYTTKILTINSNWRCWKNLAGVCAVRYTRGAQFSAPAILTAIAIETLSHRNVCIKSKRLTMVHGWTMLCKVLLVCKAMRECDFISIVIVVIIIHARLKGIFLINSLIGIMDIWCIGSCQFYHYRWPASSSLSLSLLVVWLSVSLFSFISFASAHCCCYSFLI